MLQFSLLLFQGGRLNPASQRRKPGNISEVTMFLLDVYSPKGVDALNFPTFDNVEWKYNIFTMWLCTKGMFCHFLIYLAKLCVFLYYY